MIGFANIPAALAPRTAVCGCAVDAGGSDAGVEVCPDAAGWVEGELLAGGVEAGGVAGLVCPGVCGAGLACAGGFAGGVGEGGVPWPIASKINTG